MKGAEWEHRQGANKAAQLTWEGGHGREKTLCVVVNMSGGKWKQEKAWLSLSTLPCTVLTWPCYNPAPEGLTHSIPGGLCQPPPGSRLFAWQTKSISQEITISFMHQTSHCLTNQTVPM